MLQHDQSSLPEGSASKSSARSVATVERAADVLIHFAQSGKDTLGVTEIATDLGLSKAAVHRILAALVSHDLLQLDPQSHRYALGPMLMTLGLSYLQRIDVRRLATPELQALSDLTHETATISLRSGQSRVYLDQVTPAREVIMSVRIGVPFPLHAGASSKAFLAFLPEDEIEAYLSTKLVALTPNTVTDVHALRAELADARTRGYTRSNAERQAGAASVAAPVFNHEGLPCAVISVCGPAERFAAEAERCAQALVAATGRLSKQMGYVES